MEKIFEELPREYDVIIIGTGMNEIEWEIENNIRWFRDRGKYYRCCLFSYWKTCIADRHVSNRLNMRREFDHLM